MTNIKCFYLCNGIELYSLEDLLRELKTMEDNVFYHHVNDDKNDFSAWILGEIKDKVLARQISKVKNKNKIIELINKRVNNELKKRKNVISEIREAILNG
jgi:hypothetical protein